MLRSFKQLAQQQGIWGSIEEELLPAKERGLLRGKVLNSGAGRRDISSFIEGELINQDIRWENEDRSNIQIYSSADSIPVEDACFDTVLSIAVLEHVRNPIAVVAEYLRVLRPGGYVVATVPFLQPEHKIPTDFQRWTRDGLEVLFRDAGFRDEEIRPAFTVYHTLHWILYEATTLKRGLRAKIIRYLLLPPLGHLAKTSKRKSDVLASAFHVIARKPA